jgi:hypothetical protein
MEGGASGIGICFLRALEYVALITGYRFLLVVVAALYGLALVFRDRRVFPAVRAA